MNWLHPRILKPHCYKRLKKYHHLAWSAPLGIEKHLELLKSLWISFDNICLCMQKSKLIVISVQR